MMFLQALKFLVMSFQSGNVYFFGKKNYHRSLALLPQHWQVSEVFSKSGCLLLLSYVVEAEDIYWIQSDL